jgi:colanic acid/amylovoran biosynthesis protein
MRALIIHSVPLNGGDEALLRGLLGSLDRQFLGLRPTVLCKDLARARALLPDLDLDTDLEFCTQQNGFSPADHGRVINRFEQADIVISSPGGFLHDLYDIRPRLASLSVALDFGKPVFLLGQSLGPFTKTETRHELARLLPRCKAVCVRDAASIRHLSEAGIATSNVHLTADIAFAFRTLAPALFRPRIGPVRKIGLGVRAWPLKDAQAREVTVEKATTLAHWLLDQDPAIRIEFTSTCQGVEGYHDDSLLSVAAAERLPEHLHHRVSVDRARRDPEALITYLGSLDAYIGMRLHASILAMLGGTPAMGLAYEEKTPEIFGQMGLGAFQLDHRAPADEWIAAARHFLDHAGEVQQSLAGRLDRMGLLAQRNFDVLRPFIARQAA